MNAVRRRVGVVNNSGIEGTEAEKRHEAGREMLSIRPEHLRTGTEAGHAPKPQRAYQTQPTNPAEEDCLWRGRRKTEVAELGEAIRRARGRLLAVNVPRQTSSPGRMFP